MMILTWTWMMKVRARELVKLERGEVPHLRRELRARGSPRLLVLERRRQPLQSVGYYFEVSQPFSHCLLGATTKKATGTNTKGKGKKVIDSDDDEDDEIDMLDDDDEGEEEEVVTTKKKTNRAAVLRYLCYLCLFRVHASYLIFSQPTATKKAPAKKTATKAKPKATAAQTQITFAPAGRPSRAAAARTRGKMVVSLSCV